MTLKKIKSDILHLRDTAQVKTQMIKRCQSTKPMLMQGNSVKLDLSKEDDSCLWFMRLVSEKTKMLTTGS